MHQYNITQYSFNQAKKIGVKIYPSKDPNKKIDVYKNNKFVCSIGFNGMNDFPTYLQKKGKAYADQRRKLYKLRHEKDRHVLNSPGYYADKILW